MADTTRNRVVDRATATAGGFTRRTLAWGGVALAAIILLAVNLIASSSLREARFDLTKERLFTISEGTRKALRAIDEPIDVHVYFSRKLGEVAPTYAKSFERVRTMLEQYREIARGKLRVTYFDPEPFSDTEDRATAAGLKGVRISQEGELGYFGIVGSNSTDNEANLPFLNVDRERFLEYDVTKLVVTLANQRKTTIGLISGIPIEGNPGNPMLGRPPQPGPLLIEQIKEFFEIKTIAKDVKEVPSDIGVLMVVQPEGLSAETAYAIDQFALAGGKVLALVDPVAESSRAGNPMFMMVQGPPDLSEFAKVLNAWGVDFDASKVAADRDRARQVQFGSGRRATVAHYVLWLGLNRTNINDKDVLAGDIKELNFASAGALTKTKDSTTQFTPIVRTTSAGMLVSAEAVSMMPDAVGLLRDYKPGGTPLVIAARVSGEVKSAFTEGRPKAPAKEEAKADTKDAAKEKAADKARRARARPRRQDRAAKTPPPKTADKKGAPTPKTAEKKADPPAPSEENKADAEKTPPAPPPKAHVATGKVNVIVIADTDFLHDQFWLRVREFLGQQSIEATAHNGAFVLAALENLSGTDALISLRARGVTDRPFELVHELRRKAEERFRPNEQTLLAQSEGAADQARGPQEGRGRRARPLRAATQGDRGLREGPPARPAPAPRGAARAAQGHRPPRWHAQVRQHCGRAPVDRAHRRGLGLPAAAQHKPAASRGDRSNDAQEFRLSRRRRRLSVLLAVVSFAANNQWSTGEAAGEKLLPALATRSREVAEVEVRQGDNAVVLEKKQGGNWCMKSRDGYPVDVARCARCWPASTRPS